MSDSSPLDYDFLAYAVGMCNASVCTRLDDEETARLLNASHPTGVGPWTKSTALTFASGDPMPNPCEDFTTHRHVLFEC